MNKKAIFILTILAVMALPVGAMAAAEFTLGGYIKMEISWDSTSTNKNLTAPILRNNDWNFHHGRLKFTANSTRFNLTIKGPKLWGAETTGFIETDFDSGGNSLIPGQDTLSGGNTFRMRHAMFRLNWPETELLLGQYWGYFSEFTPETAHDSGCQFMGSPTQRLPQVRLTQKFLGAWTASVLIGMPFNSAQDTATFVTFPGAAVPVVQTNPTPGEHAESPQVQAKFGFEQDLWGKAAFYGRPRGFAAQLAAGWQRSQFRAGQIVGRTFFQDQFAAPVFTAQRDSQILDHWIVMGSMFVPIIPTSSPNLAGTMSLSTQWYVGAGLNAFGEGQDANSTYLKFQSPGTTLFPGFFFLATPDLYDRYLMKQYGGFIQMQYYFTNEWFINAVWGMSKVFGVPQGTNPTAVDPFGNVEGRTYLATADQFKMLQQYNLTLWYRPIQALKFGLQYSYMRTDWLQKGDMSVNSLFAPFPRFGNKTSDVGEDHRVMFAGFFYF